MRSPNVARFMTRCPQSVEADQPLEAAHAFMREHAIRHLPVLRGGKLVGLLSQRDLYLMETIAGTDIGGVTVEEAMSEAPFVTGPDAPIEEVVREMARQKCGCAVIVEGESVVGVFTTTDALAVLADLLGERRRRSSRPTIKTP